MSGQYCIISRRYADAILSLEKAVDSCKKEPDFQDQEQVLFETIQRALGFAYEEAVQSQKAVKLLEQLSGPK